MSACPQCGTVARPTDKFCNACGTPIGRSSAPAAMPAPPPFGAPPMAPPFPQPPPMAPGGFGPAPGRVQANRCQMGHEIAPGASYCAQGHPISLEQMQFANEAYPGAPQGPGYGMPPPPFGAPPFPSPPMAPSPPLAPPPAAPPPFIAPPPPPFGVNDPSRDVPAKILRGFLIAYGTNPSGDFWPLTGGRLLVGRLGSADRLDIGLQDPTISSRHAALQVDAAGGTITVEDTGSTNGTFVNDEHIGFNGRRDLRDGDRLRFGAFTAVVKVIGRV